ALAFPRSRPRELLPYVDEIEVTPGTIVARGGEICGQAVVVMSGELGVMTATGPVGRLSRGDRFGFDELREHRANGHSLVAGSTARLLVASRAQLRAVPLV